MFDDSTFQDHAVSPRGQGSLPETALRGAAGGSVCGDILCIGLRIEDCLVTEIGFEATACSATLAAASIVVEMARGKSVTEVALIGETLIEQQLGGLPPDMRHAARLASEALHRALGVAAADESIQLAPASDERKLVAMSGGVDSAVAALLLVESGVEVIGVTLQLWDDPATDGTASCCSPQAVVQARALSHKLGIAHLTLDLRDGFRAGVVDPYLAAFGDGLTPNPCVGCNGHVRFDALDRLRQRLGSTHLATGHYARIVRDADGALLAAAADDNKDQTYMLAALDAALIERLEFPLGAIDKPRVRQIARDHNLAVADKPESQDLCFLAGIGRNGFLERHAKIVKASGPIVNRRGERLGTHDGAHLFTVGQRRGLGVAAPEPLYVLDVDMAKNSVLVGVRDELATSKVTVVGARLLRDASQVTHVKLRYRNAPMTCKIVQPHGPGRHRELEIQLDQPVDGAAPGQIACLLRHDAVIGWATIARSRVSEPITSVGHEVQVLQGVGSVSQ